MCKQQAFADLAYIISHEILTNPVLKKNTELLILMLIPLIKLGEK